jgi:hypothetical protein
MIFDTSRYPPAINVVWIPVGIFMVYHALRGVISGKFRNRGSTWTSRARFPLFYWVEAAGSLAFGIACVVVGATYVSALWRG